MGPTSEIGNRGKNPTSARSCSREPVGTPIFVDEPRNWGDLPKVTRLELLRLLAVAVPALAGLSAEELTALERSAPTSRHRSLFDPHQRATVDQLSEIIIPASNTPGARAAGVAAFIERMVADWYHEDERAAFLSGLADVDARSMRASGRLFLDAAAAEQVAVMQELETRAQTQTDAAATFWSRFKALTLYGYYNSEPGIQETLKLPFMPGYYDGDAPVGGVSGARH